MDASFQYPPPWEPIASESSASFEDEYAVEIAKGHPLYGVLARAIARRRDCDDVLFRLDRHLCMFAVVHLTWSRKEEEDIRWPRFQLFADDDDLMTQCIGPTSKDYSE